MAKIPEMDWSSDNLAEALAIFKQTIAYFIEDENINRPEKKALEILRGLGAEGNKRLQASGLSEQDKKNPEKRWTFFESQLQINTNFRVHRLQLMSMRHSEHETLDDFCMRARTTALKCQFDEELEERIIKLITASTPTEAFQIELLSKEKGFTLEQTLQEGRRFEAIIEGKSKLKAMAVPPVNIAEQQMKEKCKNCGLTHPPRKRPAYGDTCRACGKKNHWKNVCRSKHSHNYRRNKEDSRKLGHQKKKEKKS